MAPLIDYVLREYGEDRVEIIDGGHKILILFPEVVVQVPFSESKHKITDLLVGLVFAKEEGTLVNIEGSRLSVSAKEYLAEYRHSHIHSGNKAHFSSFCLGESPLVRFKYSSFTDEEKMERFFMFLEQYISQESKSGRPYAYIKNIEPKAARLHYVTRADPSAVDSGCSYFKLRIEELFYFFKIIFKNNKVKLALKSDVEFSDSEFPFIPKVFYDESGREFQAISNNQAVTIPDSYPLQFSFKGRHECRIFWDDETKEHFKITTKLNESQKRPSKIFIRELTEALSRWINQKIAEENIPAKVIEWKTLLASDPRGIYADKLSLR